MVTTLLLACAAALAAQTPVMYHNPQWSPDGRWLLFDSNRDGAPDLYAIRRDGSGLVRITDTADAEVDALWAPDGRSVLFTIGMAGHGQRYRIRLGPDLQPLGAAEPSDDDPFRVRDAEGRRELFLRSPPGERQQVFLRDGAETLQLTRGLYSEQPSFSPDGLWVLYETRPDEPPYEYVMLMRPDGSDRRTISHGSDPSWSPDGTRVLFKSDPSGTGHDHEIVSTLPDGSDRRAYGHGDHPEWSPDGRWASWMSIADDGGTDIWVAAVDTGDASCLTCGLR